MCKWDWIAIFTMYFVIPCGVCGLKQLIYFISVSQLKGAVFRCEVVPLSYHRIDTFKYLSRELVERYGKEFEVRHLLQMELFCVYFPELEIVSDLSKKLTWTHFLKLFLIDNKLHRDDYAKACKEEGWSSSVLHGKIMKLII